MKKSVTILGLLVLTGILFWACAPAFEPPEGSSYNLKREIAEGRYVQIDSTPGNLTLQPVSGDDLQIQTFTIVTNTYSLAGVQQVGDNRLSIDIDADQQVPGLNLWMVSEGQNFSRQVRDPDATHKIDYKAVKTAADTVTISLPLTENWFNKDKLIIFIDSNVATFHGEKILNQDGDYLFAEAEEDDYATTKTVNDSNPSRNNPAGLVPVNNGIAWTSRSGELIGVTNLLTRPAQTNIENGETYPLGTVRDTGSEDGDLIDEASLKTAYVIQKWVNGSWEPVEADITYAGEPTYAVSVKFTGLSEYDQLRFRRINYNIKESGSGVGGFVHRASYDNGTKDRPDTDPSAWTYGTTVRTVDKTATYPNVILPAVTAAVAPQGGMAGGYYWDITLTVGGVGGGDAYWTYAPTYNGTTPNLADAEIPRTFTDENYRSNLKVFIYKGADNQGLLDLSEARFEKRDRRVFRIYLPKSYTPFATGSKAEIYVLPGLNVVVPVNGGSNQALKPTGANWVGGANATLNW